MTKQFAAIGGHPHARVPRTVEWLTPPELLTSLGHFQLDPCAARAMPWRTATHMLTRTENGLTSRWEPTARVWMNPPYADEIGRWLARLADHGRGTALIFARTETDAFFRHVWERANALLFMRGRINFHFGERWRDPKTGRVYEVGERAPGNAGAPTVLCAYGADDADVLATCEIDGAFVPLRFSRSVLGAAIESTWREALEEFFSGRDGPIKLADLYAAFAAHPKAAGNPNYAAKLRQQLQRGPYRREAPGLWGRA